MKRMRGIAARVAALYAGLAVSSAAAITKAEWEADNSLIPTPTASSAFYIVGPMPHAGGQTAMSTAISAMDTAPARMVWWANFNTALKSYLDGLVIVFN